MIMSFNLESITSLIGKWIFAKKTEDASCGSRLIEVYGVKKVVNFVERDVKCVTLRIDTMRLDS